MTFFLDVAVMLWMLVGQMCTLTPHIPGTFIIFSGAIMYGLATEFVDFGERTTLALLIIAGISEMGSRVARKQLSRRYPFSPDFSSNITVGNVGGVIASDILLGFFGLIIWQLAVGKNILPRWDTFRQILVRSSAAALWRFVCGIIMILTFWVAVLI